MHEADEPNAVIDFLDSEPLPGHDGGDVDLLAVHADAAAGSDERISVVERGRSPAGRHRLLKMVCRLRLAFSWRAPHGAALHWIR